MDLVPPYQKGRGPFIDRSGSANYGSVTLQTKLSYMTSGAQKLRMSVCRGWSRLPGCFSWFPGAEVEGARVSSWCCRA
jgi:hypothetical protein